MIQLSPLTKRRLSQFRANRRGFWSLWIFLVLLLVALNANFIANDKPIVLSYQGDLYFPVFVDYPETAFGGDFETAAEYRDEFVQELIVGENGDEGWMLWPPIRYSYDTINYEPPCPAPTPPPRMVIDKWESQNFRNSVKYGFHLIGYPFHLLGNTFSDEPSRFPPFKPITFTGCEKRIIKAYYSGNDEYNLDNLLGTDDQARDVLARVIYGFRISVLFGLILTLISTCIGITAGAIQGYYGGKLDLFMQRMIEVWASMPYLYILIIFSSMFTPGFWSLLGILLLFSWLKLVDVVRAEFLRARNFDYVRAAKALGIPDRTIILRHVLPNAMVAALTYMPFILTASITSLTALDFLGLGLPPGSPSLGELLAQGKNNLHAPWLGFAAFFTLAIMLSLLTFIGEAVRDAFDPRKTGG